MTKLEEECLNKGAFEYCGDGPPSCDFLCIRRSTEYQNLVPKVKTDE